MIATFKTWLNARFARRRFGETHQNPDGTVTINIDAFVRSNNRRSAAYVAGLAVAILVVGVLANGARSASTDSFNATKASFANNERSACITNLRSIQAEELGNINIYFERALAASTAKEVAQVDEAFAANPLRDPLTEFADSAAATVRWIDVTEQLRPENLDRPRAQGGCGAPVTSVDDLDDAGDGDKPTGG